MSLPTSNQNASLPFNALGHPIAPHGFKTWRLLGPILLEMSRSCTQSKNSSPEGWLHLGLWLSVNCHSANLSWSNRRSEVELDQNRYGSLLEAGPTLAASCRLWGLLTCHEVDGSTRDVDHHLCCGRRGLCFLQPSLRSTGAHETNEKATSKLQPGHMQGDLRREEGQSSKQHPRRLPQCFIFASLSRFLDAYH